MKISIIFLSSARDQDELTTINQPYITFVEPNGKEYDIYFRNDGSKYVANIVATNNLTEDENPFKYQRAPVQLKSFVGPDKKNYRIDRKNETNEAVPVIGKIVRRC